MAFSYQNTSIHVLSLHYTTFSRCVYILDDHHIPSIILEQSSCLWSCLRMCLMKEHRVLQAACLTGRTHCSTKREHSCLFNPHMHNIITFVIGYGRSSIYCLNFKLSCYFTIFFSLIHSLI